MVLRVSLMLSGVLLLATPVLAQPTASYDPLKTFGPLTLPAPANTIRTGSGTPGPAYWQNRADFNIAAKIDTTAHVLTGDETVTYTNNSPEALDFLWFQMDQNLYRRDSRGYAMSGGRRVDPNQSTQGYVIDAVTVGGKAVTTVLSDTRLRASTCRPRRQAGGGQVKVQIRYHFTIPGLFGGRMAWNANKSGDIYDLAQWYPRLQVFDDVRGWDTLPYLANEFYLEYGAFDYAVTVPADMLVSGSGALMNPREVLNAQERARWDQAKASDKTVLIRTPEEVASTPAPGAATKTWRFHMEHTRDVAFTGEPGLCSGTRPGSTCRMARPPWRNRSIRRKASARRAGAGPRNIAREGRRRAHFLRALVSLPLAERDQRRRSRARHGISGHRLRRHPGQEERPVLHRRPRDRAQLVPDDRRV